MEPSANRIERFTAQLRDQPKLANPPFCPKVDAVLLESADGSVHLEQVKRVLAAEKRMSIDKLLDASLEDASVERASVPAGRSALAQLVELQSCSGSSKDNFGDPMVSLPQNRTSRICSGTGSMEWRP